MTVAQLIGLLEDLPPDAEVRLATQHNYPLEYSVYGVWAPEPEGDVEGAPTVWIAEGTQIGYGDSRAWEEAVRP